MMTTTKPMQSLTVGAVGFFGLNTQDSGITIDPSFATIADNCVIDKFGRLGARKGFRYISDLVPTAPDFKGIVEYRAGDGTDYIITWNADGFYTLSGTTLTLNTPLTTDGNYSAAIVADELFFFHPTEAPRYFDLTTQTVDLLSTRPAVQGTPPNGDVVLSAYGRAFVAGDPDDPYTVYFSTVNDGGVWGDATNATGLSALVEDEDNPNRNPLPNTAGRLDLRFVFTAGPSKITGLGAINGRLIIFCEDTIVIFADKDGLNSNLDPFSLSLVEVITGTGCVAPATVQNTGDDIVFLSKSGVRSLGRTIQEKAQPFNDYSKNIRDDITTEIINSLNPRSIQGVYSQRDSFYLVHFADSQIVYCFDTRKLLPDGAARVTRWTGVTFSYLMSGLEVLYVGKPDGVAIYDGFNDNGTAYTMEYKGTYLDLGDATVVKFLKRIRAALIGSSNQEITFNVLYDYDDDSNNERTYTTQIKSAGTSLYGLAEFGVNTYAGGSVLDNIQIAGSGSGSVVQMGLRAEIAVSELSLQKLDLYVKTGRTI